MNVVVLAAGQGTRMHSDLPKVLHRLGGRPLLGWVLEAARSLSPSRLVVVYGHRGARVREALEAPDLQWVEQQPQRGTGHAVMQALPLLDPDVATLVLYGDVPLVQPETLRRLLAASQEGPKGETGKRLALLTAQVSDPTGYGRIVRETPPLAPSGEEDRSHPDRAHDQTAAITRIVEERDAVDPALRAIREINTGMLVAPTAALKRWLQALSPANAQGEYYLTDIVAMAVAEGMSVGSAQPGALWETLGVNSRAQLAALERQWQQHVAESLMLAGVTLADPQRLDVRGDLRCGRDVEIDINCVFEGRVVLGDRVRIGAGCVLRDCEVAPDTEVLPFCHLDGARIGRAARIGPYARLRPGTELADQVHIGNFVEVKNSRLGPDSKANHLAYVGDAEVGARVNIGAGTITCNYDGAHKHPTVIEDDVFIGSDTQLVAPIRVGRGATLGAGTTLTRDAPAGQLTVSRARQVSLRGWKRPRKES